MTNFQTPEEDEAAYADLMRSWGKLVEDGLRSPVTGTAAATPPADDGLTIEKMKETIEQAKSHIGDYQTHGTPAVLGRPFFSAFPVTLSTSLPQYAKKKVTVRRSWRERLFSRPWRPWIATKVIEVDDPETPVVWMVDHRLMMHPAVKEKFASYIHNVSS